jgi:hypothetical protein
MSYTLSLAMSADRIDERRYAEGPRLRFTTFNSCIGVVGVDGGELTGVHLSLVDANGTAFDRSAADAVALIMSGCGSIVIFGQVNFWKECELSAAYQYLCAQLNYPDEEDLDEGRFQATLSGGSPRIARY